LHSRARRMECGAGQDSPEAIGAKAVSEEEKCPGGRAPSEGAEIKNYALGKKPRLSVARR